MTYTLYFPMVAGSPDDSARDLTSYLIGRSTECLRIGNERGTYERFFTRHYGSNCFALVKAWDGFERVNWELFTYDSIHIHRWADTSPAEGKFYTQYGAPWVKRFMKPGDRFSAGKAVQFYGQDDCRMLAEFSGNVTDTIEFVEHHDLYKFRALDWEPVTLTDVIRLRWIEGGEDYFYARGYGLVAWQRSHEDPNSPRWSAVSSAEYYQVPDNIRLVDIRCLHYPMVPEGWRAND